MYTKAGEKEFLKSYIGLSSCHITSTGQPAHSAGINGAVYLGLQRTMYDFKTSFFLNFLLIHRAKYIFSRDMFSLYHFRAKIHGVGYFIFLVESPL